MNTSIPSSAQNPSILSTANALSELFEHSKDSLPIEKLGWFSKLAEPAVTELINVNKSLENLALAHGLSDQSELPSPENMACILFGLSDQIDNIVELLKIADEAGFLVIDRQAEKAAGKNAKA